MDRKLTPQNFLKADVCEHDQRHLIFLPQIHSHLCSLPFSAFRPKLGSSCQYFALSPENAFAFRSVGIPTASPAVVCGFRAYPWINGWSQYTLLTHTEYSLVLPMPEMGVKCGPWSATLVRSFSLPIRRFASRHFTPGLHNMVM